MNILIKGINFDQKVIDLIYDKQREFNKENRAKFSLERTVEKLLKDAYLNGKK